MILVTQLPERWNHTQQDSGRASSVTSGLGGEALTAKGGCTHSRWRRRGQIQGASSGIFVFWKRSLEGNLQENTPTWPANPLPQEEIEAERRKRGASMQWGPLHGRIHEVGFQPGPVSIPVAVQTHGGVCGLSVKKRKPRDVPRSH